MSRRASPRHALEPQLSHQRSIARILPDRIEPRMHAQHDQTGRSLFDGYVEPAECFVDVAKARMHYGDPPRRHDSGGSSLGELGEDSPRFRDVPTCRLEMRQAKRWAGNAAGEPAPFLVLGPRLVETTQCFERAREAGVRPVETRVELDRHPKVEHRLLVLAGEVVCVAGAGVNHHRKWVEAYRLVRLGERLFIALVRIEGAAEQVVRRGKTRVELDGFLQRAQSSGKIAGMRQDRAHRDVSFGERWIQLQRSVRGGRWPPASL